MVLKHGKVSELRIATLGGGGAGMLEMWERVLANKKKMTSH